MIRKSLTIVLVWMPVIWLVRPASGRPTAHLSESGHSPMLYFPLQWNGVGSGELFGGTSPTVVANATSDVTSTPSDVTPNPARTSETPTQTPTPIPPDDPLPSQDGIPLCYLTIDGVSQASGVSNYNWNFRWDENTMLKTSKVPIITGHPTVLDFQFRMPMDPQFVFMGIHKVTPESMFSSEDSPWARWPSGGRLGEPEYIGNTRDITTGLDLEPGWYVLNVISIWNHPDSHGEISYGFFVDIR